MRRGSAAGAKDFSFCEKEKSLDSKEKLGPPAVRLLVPAGAPKTEWVSALNRRDGGNRFQTAWFAFFLHRAYRVLPYETGAQISCQQPGSVG